MTKTVSIFGGYILLVLGTVIVMGIILILKPFLSILTNTQNPSTTTMLPTSEFKITDGNLYISDENGSNFEIAVNASDLEEESQISTYVVSPTKTNVCFLVQTFGPEWLYYAKIENGKLTGVQRIALGENCVWNHEGNMIAFTNSTSDVSPHNVYLFDVATKNNNPLTFYKYDDEYLRMYKVPSWSADDKYIYSNYLDYILDDGGNMQVARQGKSTIDWAESQVTDTIF
jgi:Tol biopolymer transport system component